MRERATPWLLLACFVLLPFGRAVELPMLLAAMSGLACLRGGRSLWQDPTLRLASVLFLGYWLPQLLSTVAAVDPRRSWGEVAVDLRYLPMLWCFASGLRSEAAQRLALHGIALVLAVWLIDALAQAVGGWSLGGAASSDRLSGIFGADHLKLGAMVAVLSPFLLVAAANRSRWLAVIGLLAILLVVLLAGTRAAWVMVLVVLATLGLGLLGLRRGLAVVAASIVAAVLLGALAYQSSDSFAARIDRSAEVFSGDREGLDHALAFRLPIWRTSLAMTAAYPWTGVGVRGFRVAYAEYAEEGDRWIGFDGEHGAAHAHNIVLELLSETGVLGLLCWLAAMSYAIRQARAAPPPGSTGLASLAALAAMLFPLNTHYAVYSSVWGGLLLVLAGIWVASLSARGPGPPRD